MEDNSVIVMSVLDKETTKPPCKPSFPHVLVATIVSFLFGYHLVVLNEPLESISTDLGFVGNSMAEGLKVSICLTGAFVGSLFSGRIAYEVGRQRKDLVVSSTISVSSGSLRRFRLPKGKKISESCFLNPKESTWVEWRRCRFDFRYPPKIKFEYALKWLGRRAFQLSALPMLFGASIWLLVVTSLGVGPPFTSLYVTEISPAHLRGTYGSLIQIGSGLGLIGALLTGFPVKTIFVWWRICFWVSTVPAAILALSIMFCAESPYWLYKQGRNNEARAELDNLLGSVHAKAAMEELSKLERVDEISSMKLVELLHGRHSRVVFLGSTLFALQQLSGINAVFYFSSTVFRRAGVSSNLASVFVGIANLIGSVVSLLLMDKLGRKVLLICSFVGMVDYRLCLIKVSIRKLAVFMHAPCK